MLRALVRRVVSAGLILVIGGATNAPILDLLLFHGRGKNETVQPHYSSAKCHAERCAIQYPTRVSGPTLEAAFPLRILTLVRDERPQRPTLAVRPPARPDHHRPRAPPSFV